MKRKWMILAVTSILILSAAGCSQKEEKTSQAATKTESKTDLDSAEKEMVEEEKPIQAVYDNSTLGGILNGISSDFEVTIQYLNEELENVYAGVGESYEKYVENKQILEDWYALAISESEKLFDRTEKASEEYFILIPKKIDCEDDDAIDDAMDEFYEVVYEDAMDEYYDAVYEDAMDDIFDAYYDGIVADGYEEVPYAEWSAESSDCYRTWSDTSSSIYRTWSDAGSAYYRLWSDVSSSFYRENYDIKAFLEERDRTNEKEEDKELSSVEEQIDTLKQSESESAEQEIKEAVEDVETKIEEAVTEVAEEVLDPEFKAAMDSYEAFFDEYIAFMEKYTSAGTEDMLGMRDEYLAYMEQYADVMEKMAALDSSELSTAEALYYSEVSNRISKKLLEAQ